MICFITTEGCIENFAVIPKRFKIEFWNIVIWIYESVSMENKDIDKSYCSTRGYDREVIETMEDLFLLGLFEIYINCVL